ncbi:hypothetical protein LCGC14_1231830 [marine sediment metagenome]|uniref:Uncharacterized protein n=1 Tax=marine sediment metagenome TaxID=412755 RepID=A0A0F9L8C1_9ZZZZ
MIITRHRIQTAIKRYANAFADASWKGGGDPADIPSIEQELKNAKLHLNLLVLLIVPAGGLDVERTEK